MYKHEANNLGAARRVRTRESTRNVHGMAVLLCHVLMSNLFFADAPTEGKESAVFPLSHRVPRVEDRRVSRGIVDVIRDGFRWGTMLR